MNTDPNRGTPPENNIWQAIYLLAFPVTFVAWALVFMSWGTITTILTMPKPAFIAALVLAMVSTGLTAAPFVIYARNNKDTEK